jgi:hypothetical protein
LITGVAFLAVAAVLAVAVVLIWRDVFAEAEIPPEIRVPGGAAVDTQECRLAVHEAGHAVAAWCCTLVAEVDLATIEHKDKIEGWEGGVVRYSFYGVNWMDDRWCKMVIALSGVAAEAMVYSRWRTTGSQADLLKALAVAESLASSKNPVDPPWRRLGAIPGDRVPDLASAFRSKPSSGATGNLEEGYRMARRVLRSHGGAFFKVVSMLLAKKSTTKADIEALLGKRYFATFALAGAHFESIVNESGRPERFKPGFVLPKRKKAA